MAGKELEKEAKEYARQNSEILVDNTDAFITSEEYLEKGYLAAAERIEELEQELEQAKKVQVVEHFEAYGQCRDSRRIAVLEKENAELNKLRCCENCKNVNLQLHWRESKKCDEMRQCVCGTCGNLKHWEYLGKTVGITETQQLTKAREIIRTFLNMPMPNNEEVFADVGMFLTKAEQFLKECK